MSHVQELIKRQAEAMRQHETNIKVAAELEKRAAELRAAASAPVAGSFRKALVADRAARLDRFNIAMKQVASKADEIEHAKKCVLNAGFVKVQESADKKKTIFFSKATGLHLIIDGKHFSVKKGDQFVRGGGDVLQRAWGSDSIDNLPGYLQNCQKEGRFF